MLLNYARLLLRHKCCGLLQILFGIEMEVPFLRLKGYNDPRGYTSKGINKINNEGIVLTYNFLMTESVILWTTVMFLAF